VATDATDVIAHVVINLVMVEADVIVTVLVEISLVMVEADVIVTVLVEISLVMVEADVIATMRLVLPQLWLQSLLLSSSHLGVCLNQQLHQQKRHLKREEIVAIALVAIAHVVTDATKLRNQEYKRIILIIK
jgi:hypothetical protein